MTTLEKLTECKKLLEEVMTECQQKGDSLWPSTLDEDWVGRNNLYLAKQLKTNVLGHTGWLEYYIEVVKRNP